MTGSSADRNFAPLSELEVKQRPLLTVDDLAAVFESAPFAQLIILPDDPAFTLVSASDAYFRLTGVKRADIIGKALAQAFPDNPANSSSGGLRRLIASLRKAISTRCPDQLLAQRYDLQTPGAGATQFQKRYWNTQNTPILAADGSVSFILHSIEDVTDRVEAEESADAAKRHQQISEKRFRQLVEASTLGIMIGFRDGRVSYANPEVLRLLEYTPEDVAAGMLRWDKLTPPEYRSLDLHCKRQMEEKGFSAPYEKVYLTKSGKRVPILLGAARLEPFNGCPESAAFVWDLTERKKSERDAFLVELDDLTLSLHDPQEVVTIAAQMLGTRLDVDRCAYGTYEADQDTVILKTEYVRAGVEEVSGRHSLTLMGEEWARCLRANLAYVFHGNLALGDKGAGARISIPIHKAGKLVASFGVSHIDRARVWLPDEVELVKVVAHRCWESIERARVMRELQASEQRLRLAQRAARIGSYEYLMKENRVIWTPELETLYGLPEGAFEGNYAAWVKRVLPADAASVSALIADCIAREEAECNYEFRIILPDGSLRWLRGQAQIFYDETGAPERRIGVNFDITAQKQAEADLRESAERLRAIFDGTYEYIGLLAPDGTLIEANRALLEFAGNSLAQVAGKPFWETPWFALTPGVPEVVRQAIAKAATGEFVRFEATLFKPSRECRTFDLSLHPVTNQQGEVTLIVPEGRDITERKLAEEKLQQQWHTFDTALSNTPDLTYTFDLDGRFTYANRRLCQVSQRSLKDTVGKSPAELGYAPDLVQRMQSQIRQVVETKQEIRSQTSFKLKTGEVREYEYIYAPVIGDSGQVEAIAGSTRDITERKEAEELLRTSEMKFRQLFDSLPQLVWSSTPDGKDDLYNKQWFEFTGLSYEDVQGSGYVIIHPDDLPGAIERWQRSLKTGEPYEVEYRCRRSDGQYRWFLGRANPVLNERGEVVRWFGTCTDIHDKKESETALRKAHRELEEFSYVASHDLQEPLRMVAVYTQLMLKEVGHQEGKVGFYAGYVRQGLKRMEILLGDLLTFSRAVHTEVSLHDRADLAASLAEAQSVLGTHIEECGATVTAGPLPQVRGDGQQLAHVFQNLLSNALKYRKKDQPPEIRISAQAAAEEWIVSVQDNGIGFDPQYAQRIFGLFKRLHKEEYPGTGLGLAICQRIVERHGGRMWAESKLGQGATFHFSLGRLAD